MIRPEKVFFLSVLLSIAFSVYAQDRNDDIQIPLTTILAELEVEHDVKFSYSPEDLTGLMTTAVLKYDLNIALSELSARLPLSFKFIDDRYITVTVLLREVEICGRIIDEESGIPLETVSVRVLGRPEGSITNAEGIFKLGSVSIKTKVEISLLGYETLNLSVISFLNKTNECPDILLGEMPYELNEIVLTKFLTTGLQSRTDGSLELNTAKFGILPGLTDPDVLQSIQALPGVESINESIANINVRGGTNDQNLMLWDGIKMYHSGHFFGLISAYNPNLTEKVIVIKNGTSAEFSDGVSSTVNMLTADKIGDEIRGGAGVNLLSADAFLQIPFSKRIGLHLSGRRSISDAVTTPTFDNYFERSFQDSDISTQAESNENSEIKSDFRFYDFSAKLLVDFNNDHAFRVNFISIDNALNYTQVTTDESSQSVNSSELFQRNLGGGFKIRSDWSDRFSTLLQGHYSRYNVESDDFRSTSDQRLSQANEVLETGIKFHALLHLFPFLDLKSGYQFNETGILNETLVSAPSYERTKKDVLLNHAIYLEGEYHKGNTYLRLGGRLNYFEKFQKFIFEPRLVWRQKISDYFALSVKGEFKNQSATQIVDFQDDFLGVENRRWILANGEDIPISESKQASFGLEYSQDRLLISATAFFKEVENITASSQGFYNSFQYVKATGRYEVQGIEFLLNKTSDRYSGWVSYTSSINDYEFPDLTPSRFPNSFDIRHSVSAAFNLNIFDSFEISLGGLWRTGTPYSAPVPGNETIQNGSFTVVNYGDPNNLRLDDFYRLDSSIRYSFNLTPEIMGSLRAGVINLTNRKNIINRYYEVDPDDSEKTIQVDNVSLGITPNISLRINF